MGGRATRAAQFTLVTSAPPACGSPGFLVHVDSPELDLGRLPELDPGPDLEADLEPGREWLGDRERCRDRERRPDFEQALLLDRERRLDLERVLLLDRE